MARYGVIGDIHGNREALDAVLRALEARGLAQFLCVGDIVGYNADPDECVAMVRSRCAVSIAGNHELIGLGRLDFRRCSSNAEYALRRTRRTLGPEAAAWLAGLPPHHVLEQGVVLVHGGVRDVQQYMKTAQHIRQNAAYLREDFPGARICFFGHSHEQKVYEIDGEEVKELPLERPLALDRHKTYFINPGSVDASRKRSHKLAECAVLDTGTWSIEFLRLPYDCAATEAKAAVFGYRIGAWTDRFYTLRRRLRGKDPRRGAGR
ncbi:MAG TPA: metallophosphoesterase family protein [Burkholderiales bacterium]